MSPRDSRFTNTPRMRDLCNSIGSELDTQFQGIFRISGVPI